MLKIQKFVAAAAPTRRDWSLLAGLGLAVPALVAFTRLCLLRGTIWGIAGFMPLDGPIGGCWPHIFFRIMHDLTHPVLLLSYCWVFAWLTLRLRATAPSRGQGVVAWFGILLAHLIMFFAYAWSLFLPVGDMVTVIRPG